MRQVVPACLPSDADMCSGLGQGAVTVVAMAIPALFTLLTLLRLEAEKAVDRKKMQWQVLEVLQQRSLLQQSQPLSMPIESLSVRMLLICKMLPEM